MIHSDALKLIRNLSPLLIGSSSYGIPCNDIDILISVKFDIQIATPENYAKKRKAHEVILRQRLYVGKSKRQRYMLYKSLYELM